MGIWKQLIVIVFLILVFKTTGLCQNCKIVAPPYTCIDNLISLKLTTTGGTPQAYSWKLGDGRTAQQAEPGFAYNKAGTYIISAEVTFTNGIKRTDTATIIVYAPPVASFTIGVLPDFCDSQKTVCINDNSTPGPANNPISKKTLLWGDGSGNNTIPAAQKQICHTYTSAGQYLLAMEITDTKGCNTKALNTITIDEPLVTRFSTTVKKVPGECKILSCFNNTSTPLGNYTKFRWLFGDGETDSTSSNPCHEYKNNGSYTVSLISKNANGCIDTFTQNIVINKATVNTNLKVSKTICLNDNMTAFNDAVNPSNTKYKWEIEDSATGSGELVPNTNPIQHKFIKEGKYYITLIIDVDSCIKEVRDSVDVLCPKAVFSIYNNDLCIPGDTTFLCADICRYKANNVTFIWDLNHGEQCTTDTKKGLNTKRNCQYSLDQNVKHLYDFASPGDKFSRYKPTLIAKDTVTGCTDIASKPVILGTLDMSKYTVSHEAEEYCTKVKLTNVKRRIKYTLGGDSAIYSCKITINGDCEGDSTYFEKPPDLKNITFEYLTTTEDSVWKTVGIAFQNGGDFIYSSCNQILKPGTFCYDTAWINNLVNIMPSPQPQLSTDTVFKGCKPYNISVKLKDTIQKNIKSIQWIWGDGTDEIYYPAPGDSLLPAEKQHTYKLPGQYLPKVIMNNTRNCEEIQPLKLVVGYVSQVVKDSLVCAQTSVKFKETIRYYDSIYDFWKDPNRSHNGKEELWWDFDDGQGFVKKLQGQGGYFASEGLYNIRMATKDSTGCTDTTAFTVKALKPIAGFRQLQDTIYCNDNIVQFYDSSIGSTISPAERIVSWRWDFGDNTGIKPQQNPLYIFKTYGDKIIKLVVANATGCYDTAYSAIHFVGPEPSFEIISDSTGCVPLKVSFKNISKNSSSWVWNMGDINNTIISSGRDTNISFVYTTPGTFYVTLLGSDSIYNPYTKNKYFCNAQYPQPPVTKKVVASANYKTAFTMADTVCVNSRVVFQNYSPVQLNNFTWDFGNGSTKQVLGRGLQINTYKDTGTFWVNLRANLLDSTINSKCVTDTSRKIYVEGIKAGFDVSLHAIPTFNFINTSSADAVRYKWDFGDPSAGANNHSTQKNPSHKFTKLDTFKVCLISYNHSGCPDTFCRYIINDYRPYLFIPNVITPGGSDTVNDAFDILANVCKNYHLKIYNRWGEQVFEGFEDGVGNTDIRNWNGNQYNTGNPCPTGVYYVTFDYEMAGEDERKRYKGTVTLLREY